VRAFVAGYGPFAPLVYVLATAVGVVFAPIPGPALALAGGYVFGWFLAGLTTIRLRRFALLTVVARTPAHLVVLSPGRNWRPVSWSWRSDYSLRWLSSCFSATATGGDCSAARGVRSPGAERAAGPAETIRLNESRR
jgi:membrane protein DedA with SNARE-associated domain